MNERRNSTPGSEKALDSRGPNHGARKGCKIFSSDRVCASLGQRESRDTSIAFMLRPVRVWSASRANGVTAVRPRRRFLSHVFVRVFVDQRECRARLANQTRKGGRT